MYTPLGSLPPIEWGDGMYGAPPAPQGTGGAVVLPELTVTAQSPYLLYVGLGVLAVYFLFGKGHGRKVW